MERDVGVHDVVAGLEFIVDGIGSFSHKLCHLTTQIKVVSFGPTFQFLPKINLEGEGCY